jgi:hypothetical protein
MLATGAAVFAPQALPALAGMGTVGSTAAATLTSPYVLGATTATTGYIAGTYGNAAYNAAQADDKRLATQFGAQALGYGMATAASAYQTVHSAVGPKEASLFDKHQWGKPDSIPCFPAEALVHTPDGLREIQTLREGDLVFAYDSTKGVVTARPITACLGNWTQHLVKIKIGDETIWATRIHPFFLPETNDWLPAAELRTGMKVLGIDLEWRVIQDVQVMGTHEDTFNITVADFHTFFVGRIGLLVHNAGYSSLEKTSTQVYTVRNTAGEPVYVGKTTQGLDVRFQQHINKAHPEWANGYSIRSELKGKWTNYESSVWEQHVMDTLGGKTSLQNTNNAIAEASYNQYKSAFNPC